MKNYFRIAAILGAITLVCAVILALMNMLTSPIIAKNNDKTKLETIQKIYEDYDSEKSKDYEESEIESLGLDGQVVDVIRVNNSNGDLKGYVFTVSGKNAYGTITLMVAISKDTNGNNVVHQVEFLENGQSFASTVDDHVRSSYHTSDKNAIVLDPYSSDDKVTVGDLDSTQVSSINVSCGATYGATLVRNLVEAALQSAERMA
ncbi:MAG: hypothetical protein K6F81_04700 [Acholeplasmatales bacterium]|nr:hypothetical protein [Acholeplasmatales bacterium]